MLPGLGSLPSVSTSATSSAYGKNGDIMSPVTVSNGKNGGTDGFVNSIAFPGGTVNTSTGGSSNVWLWPAIIAALVFLIVRFKRA